MLGTSGHMRVAGRITTCGNEILSDSQPLRAASIWETVHSFTSDPGTDLSVNVKGRQRLQICSLTARHGFARGDIDQKFEKIQYPP